MHAQCSRQFNIGCVAGTCDEDQVMAILRFCKDLMQVCAQHLESNHGKMNAWQMGNRPWHFRGGMQDESPGLRQKINGFGNTQIAERHFMFAGLRGNKFHSEGVKNLGTPHC